MSQDNQNSGEGERGALLVTVLTVLLIVLAGTPCFCYFGIGLFQGVFFLDSGNYVNPARARDGQQQRDPKYDRHFDENGEPIPAPKRSGE